MTMKNSILPVAVFSIAFALAAWAAEPVVCAVNVATGAATTTGTPTSGTCTWAKGANVLMQCDVDVYVDSQSGGTATSADQRVNFTSNNDPYIVYLDANDQNISLLSVSASGSCKFMTTKRPKPGK
jgi:hypothetical protein